MRSIHSRVIGWLLLIVGALMMVPALVAFILSAPGQAAVGREVGAFLVSIAFTLGAGAVMLSASKGAPPRRITVSDGFMLAALSWIAVSIFSCLPYILSGAITNPVDAFFESMSGLTTTGASILSNLDELPRGVMFWRCMTQAIGGMGIVMLFVAILPAVGEGGHNLFRAEIPGGMNFEKVTPRARATARALWIIYVGFMAVEALALYLTGMPLYDAVCHAFTTLSTGGFSPYQESIGAVKSLPARWIIIFFMLVGGASFTLHFRAIKGEGKKAYFTSHEFLAYVGVIGVAGFILSLEQLIRNWGASSVMTSVTDGFFQVTAIITTTGYVTADFGAWSSFAQGALFFLMFIGGCAGSTGGSVKVIRNLIAVKAVLAELRVMANPREVVAPKLQGKPLSDGAMRNTLVFMALYVTLFVFSGLALALMGLDMVTAFSASATCIGNVGPGLGEVGPALNFGSLPSPAKLLLVVEMLMGRLELFGVMIFFMAAVGSRRGTKKRPYKRP